MTITMTMLKTKVNNLRIVRSATVFFRGKWCRHWLGIASHPDTRLGHRCYFDLCYRCCLALTLCCRRNTGRHRHAAVWGFRCVCNFARCLQANVSHNDKLTRTATIKQASKVSLLKLFLMRHRVTPKSQEQLPSLHLHTATIKQCI